MEFTWKRFNVTLLMVMMMITTLIMVDGHHDDHDDHEDRRTDGQTDYHTSPGLTRQNEARETNRHWYCVDNKCQGKRPEWQQCEQCEEVKDKRIDFRNTGDRRYSRRCRICEFPSCSHAECTMTFSGNKALRKDSLSIVGNRWFCNVHVAAARKTQASCGDGARPLS